MRYWLLAAQKFFALSIANVIVGSGLGFVTAWFMTTGLDRSAQMALSETGGVLGGGLGLLLGWLAYYVIFKRRVSYNAFCSVIGATAVVSALAAYILQRLTDTGGWLAIFFAVGVFIATSWKLRRSGAQ